MATSSVEILSIAPSAKSDHYGVRAIHRGTATPPRLLDALFDQTSGEVTYAAFGDGLHNPGLADEVAAVCRPLVKGKVPRLFTFLRVDIVGHSTISARRQQKETELTWDALAETVFGQVQAEGGEVWGWQGDGGLAAFSGEDSTIAATKCAISLQNSVLPAFNEDNENGNRLAESVRVRVAVHTGLAKKRLDKGLIHSRDINFVSHLEAQRTPPGGVTISSEVFIELPKDLQELFHPVAEAFEGHNILSSASPRELEEYITTRHSSNEELQRELLDLARQKRELEIRLESGADIKAVRFLRAEIKENLASIENSRYTSIPLNVDAWNHYKGDLDDMPADLQQCLQEVYLDAEFVNKLTRDHTQCNDSRSRSSLIRKLSEVKSELKGNLARVNSALVSWAEEHENR